MSTFCSKHGMFQGYTTCPECERDEFIERQIMKSVDTIIKENRELHGTIGELREQIRESAEKTYTKFDEVFDCPMPCCGDPVHVRYTFSNQVTKEHANKAIEHYRNEEK